MSEYNNSFRQNVLDTVIKTLHYEEPHTQRYPQITEATRFDEDLDIEHIAMCFFLCTLEDVTLLDLDTNVNVDSLWTVGDLCDLVEKRFNEADKCLLMHKLFTKKILPGITFNQAIIVAQPKTQATQEKPITQTTQNKGETMIKLLEGYSHPIDPASVFYNVKQILLVQNHEKAVNLTMDMEMIKDLNISGRKLADLTIELQNRYKMTVSSHAKIQKAKTLKEFCTICAADFNAERIARLAKETKGQQQR